jgi:hypothetical protein
VQQGWGPGGRHARALIRVQPPLLLQVQDYVALPSLPAARRAASALAERRAAGGG